jgi:uncharacterized protein DUF1259
VILATRLSAGVLLSCGLVTCIAGTASAQTRSKVTPPGYWKPVEDVLGRKGVSSAGDVVRFGFPRTDLNVVLDGVTLKPTLALGSWVAFKRIGDHVMVMGDLVLLEDEVSPVMGSLQQNGIEQTALHNHVLDESPRVVYMHIRAIGNPGRIARAVRAALEFTQTPLGPAATAAPTAPAAAFEVDTSAIAKVMGVRGRLNGGVYQLSIPRREKIREDKVEITPAMGVGTVINFQPVGEGKAAVTGDFVLLGREVSPVIWALAENGIAVTAIHSHMLNEQPRLFFMHFWAIDDAVKLARGLRTALDRTRRRR